MLSKISKSMIPNFNSPPSPDNYLFLGMPNCGKTVLFVAMIHAFQSYLSEYNIEDIHLVSADPASDSFVRSSVKDLESGVWPEKTFKKIPYSFNLTEKAMIIFENDKHLIYQDFPGETVYSAYCDDVESDDGIKFKNNIKEAKGVFLLVDSSNLYEALDDDIATIAAGICQNLKESKVKVAVIFTKMDLFTSVDFDPKEMFNKKYVGAAAHLRKLGGNVKYFEMDVVNQHEMKDGARVPASNYTVSENALNIIKPALWMWDLENLEQHSQPDQSLWDQMKKTLGLG